MLTPCHTPILQRECWKEFTGHHTGGVDTRERKIIITMQNSRTCLRHFSTFKHRLNRSYTEDNSLCPLEYWGWIPDILWEVTLFICFPKLVFMSKFPGLPFSSERCPLLPENPIKQCSLLFNLWKVEKVTCCVWVFYSQNMCMYSVKQINKTQHHF